MTPEAWDFFTYQYEERIPAQRLDYRLAGYQERKGLHLLKVAMLISLAEKDELVMTTTDLEFALAQLENLEPLMVQAVAGVGRNPISGNMIRMYEDLVRENTIVSKGTIVERFGADMNAAQIDEAINNLLLMKRIEPIVSTTGLAYRAITRKNNGK
jgi:hypothetical protein